MARRARIAADFRGLIAAAPAGSHIAAPAPMAAARVHDSAPYIAGSDFHEAMIDFNPDPSSGEGDIRDRGRIAARARDIVRNNGYATAAIQKEVDAVVGVDFRPRVRPDADALGISPEEAIEFGKKVEARWRTYADDPRNLVDVTRQTSFGGLMALAYGNYMLEGDALGAIMWREDRPTPTCLRVIDPDLLATPAGQADGAYLRQGVEIDDDGAAVAYHFSAAHGADRWAGAASFKSIRLARETAWGRPVVLHHFDRRRDGQTRGVSRLAPVIEKLRMGDHYSRVELQAAVINAVLAAYIESPFDNSDVVDMLSEGDTLAAYTDARAAYHKGNEVRLAGARLPHLYPGERIGTVPVARPAAQFSDFESAVLRHIAAGAGLSYEQLAADWSKTNYSSARAALLEIWRGWNARRRSFAQGFAQPFFMAWLEGEVSTGRIAHPGLTLEAFRANWVAWSRARWVGPGRGFVDPIKEVQAAAMRVALGFSTMADEAAELSGSDYSENLRQIAREIEEMPAGMLHPAQQDFAKLVGVPPGAAPAAPAQGPAAPAQDEGA